MNAQPEVRTREVVALCTLAFLVLGSYAVARPAIESLYLEAYGSAALPMAWLGVAIFALIVVAVYGRFSDLYDLTTVFQGALAVFSIVLIVLLYAADSFAQHWAVYGLYLWKDIYIVVLVEMFWSIANSVFALKSAKWLYGLFCVMGSLGGITANLSIGPLAKSIGTANAPWLVLPLFLISAFVCAAMPRVSKKESTAANSSSSSSDAGQDAGFLAGWSTVRKSDYLTILLVIIALVQIVLTLVDYRYNALLENAYPNVDERTAVIGQVYAAIDGTAMCLQLGAGLVISALGVGGTILTVPALLLLAIIAFLISPVFLAMAVAKVASKALDYSLFRAAKELLYLPLNHGERTRGKAVVDILTYRVAKGLASVCLLVLAAAETDPSLVLWVAGVLTLLWLCLSGFLVRHYRARVALPTQSKALEEPFPTEP